MEFDLGMAIDELVPAAEYSGSTNPNTQECYDMLTWNDARQKPTWEAILAAWGVWIARYEYDQKHESEQVWRRAEMEASTSQIHRFEDDDEDREPGTMAEWRAYRKSVRHWNPDHAGYPDQAYRPQRPS